MNPPKSDQEVFLAQWLNNEISDEELKKLVSSEDFISYVKIREGLGYFEPPEFDADRLYQKISGKLQKKERRVIDLKWFYAAAAVLLIIFSAYFYNYFLPVKVSSDFGEHRTVLLNDGSEATLNSRAFISYPKKWKKKRELRLKGEAFFKVKKGKSFTVSTENGSVTVLGTQFNVNSQPGYFSVKCFEGKVMVVQSNDTTYLSRGYAFQSDGVKVDQWNFENEKPFWLLGESVFRSTPLKIVIRHLENQFGIEILTGNVDVDQLFTGSFANDNLNLALKSVCIPMEVNYKKENNKIHLSKK